MKYMKTDEIYNSEFSPIEDLSSELSKENSLFYLVEFVNKITTNYGNTTLVNMN